MERQGIAALLSPSLTPLKLSPMSASNELDEESSHTLSHQNLPEDISHTHYNDDETSKVMRMMRMRDDEMTMTEMEKRKLEKEMLGPSFVLNWERGQVRLFIIDSYSFGSTDVVTSDYVGTR